MLPTERFERGLDEEDGTSGREDPRELAQRTRVVRDRTNRAMMLEETARLLLYCRQFGGELAVIPPEWVRRLEPIKDFL